MKFEPYHQFAECERLERVVTQVAAAGHAPVALVDAYNRYHFSLIHKLRSAYWHVTTLSSYLSQADPSTSVSTISYRANFHFDGFCNCVGSAKDIFAREVLTYFAVPLPDRVYFHTAREQLQAARPADLLLPLLADPTWQPEFRDYRNTTTHECVVSTAVTIHVVIMGGTETRRLEVPLPLDPRNPGGGGIGHADIIEYCETTFRRTVSLFNRAYKQLADRIGASGSLPL